MVIGSLSLPLDLNALGETNEPLSAEVIPPPGPHGLLPARNGRRQYVADTAALVARLNGQAVAARVDFDHRSEPVSPTFAGSTEAEGWLSSFRLNARGGIDADMALSDWAHQGLRARRYRYLSPALLLDDDDVVGMSSLALVNNPNLPLSAPTLHSEAPMDKDEKARKAELDERERKLEAREAEAQTAALNAATQAVDAAVASGRVLPAHKDYHLGAIKAHPDGVWKGIESFNAFAAGEAGDATRGQTAALATRTGPSGAPPSADDRGRDPAFNGAPGWQPPSEGRLALHARIADYAAQRGIPYRQALTEFGALHGA